MDNLIIEATKRTPEIRFDSKEHQLLISGESYPEDVNQFYGAIISGLESYLAHSNNELIMVKFDFIYFNSSSVKAMIRIFDMLDDAANNNSITVQWLH